MSDPSTKSPILVDNDISLNARMAGSSSVDSTPSEPDSIENGSGGDTNQTKRLETVTYYVTLEYTGSFNLVTKCIQKVADTKISAFFDGKITGIRPFSINFHRTSKFPQPTYSIHYQKDPGDQAADLRTRL
eukprot:Awhi_evm2s9963